MVENDSMPKKERERLVLEFMDSSGVMFKPRALFDNLVEYEEITFGYKTVVRYLEDFEERGLVEQVGDRSYYRITDCGRDYLAGDLDADDLE